MMTTAAPPTIKYGAWSHNPYRDGGRTIVGIAGSALFRAGDAKDVIHGLQIATNGLAEIHTFGDDLVLCIWRTAIPSRAVRRAFTKAATKVLRPAGPIEVRHLLDGGPY